MKKLIAFIMFRIGSFKRGGLCRTVRDLSVVDVVPLDVLLEVLGSEARPVAERVHRLLLPSYFGRPEDGPACVAALLRQHPEVAFPPHLFFFSVSHILMVGVNMPVRKGALDVRLHSLSVTATLMLAFLCGNLTASAGSAHCIRQLPSQL